MCDTGNLAVPVSASVIEPAPRSLNGRRPEGVRPLLKHKGSIGTSFCEVNALPAGARHFGGASERRSPHRAAFTSLAQQYLQRADSFQVAAAARCRCAIICRPCPTRRRPRSSVPCRGRAPTAGAISAAAGPRARTGPRAPTGPRARRRQRHQSERMPRPGSAGDRRPRPGSAGDPSLVARLRGEALVPGRCDSPDSPRARPPPPGHAGRSRRPGRSFSRRSYRPPRSWRRSGSRSALARCAAPSVAFRGRSFGRATRRRRS